MPLHSLGWLVRFVRLLCCLDLLQVSLHQLLYYSDPKQHCHNLLLLHDLLSLHFVRHLLLYQILTQSLGYLMWSHTTLMLWFQNLLR